MPAEIKMACYRKIYSMTRLAMKVYWRDGGATQIKHICTFLKEEGTEQDSGDSENKESFRSTQIFCDEYN